MASSPHVRTFTDDNFDTEVMKAEMPVLVDVSATWCQPCQFLAPTIAAVAEEFAGKAKVGMIDADESQKVTMQLGVMALPTVIIFKRGQVVKKFFGGHTKKEDLVAALNEATKG
jgi:thioredoxin 1